MKLPKDTKDWEFQDLLSECVLMLMDNFIQQGGVGLRTGIVLCFNLYDQWKGQSKKKWVVGKNFRYQPIPK